MQGDRLVIRYRSGGIGPGIRPTEPVNFFVTVRELSGISLSGSGRVRDTEIRTDRLEISTSGSSEVTMDVTAEELRSQSSGSGRFALSGEADEQRIDISGSGRYDARDLVSRECEVRISGSGSAIVQVSERLDIDISGSGDVSYIGDPQIDQNISGSGRVRRLEE